MIASVTILMIAMASIQFGASIAKQLFPLLGPGGTTLMRTSIAAALLIAIWRPWRKHYARPARRFVALYGVTLGCMNLLFYFSLERIPLGVAVALEFTGPLTLALISSRRLLDFVWVILASTGITLILPFSFSKIALDPKGIALALGAGVCWAFYIIFGKRAGQSGHGGQITSLGMVAAAMVSLPIGFQSAGPYLGDSNIWILATTVAIMSSALPYSLEMIALKNLPFKTFSVLMSLEPAIAALMGFLFLHEVLSNQHWLAIGCIMLASAGCAMTSPRIDQSGTESTLENVIQ